MAVTKPRNRLVNFRVSEEEFESLREACQSGGARSVSDFARIAVLANCREGRTREAALAASLATLDHKVENLGTDLRVLLSRLVQPAPKSSLDALHEQVLRHGAGG